MLILEIGFALLLMTGMAILLKRQSGPTRSVAHVLSPDASIRLASDPHRSFRGERPRVPTARISPHRPLAARRNLVDAMKTGADG